MKVYEKTLSGNIIIICVIILKLNLTFGIEYGCQNHYNTSYIRNVKFNKYYKNTLEMCLDDETKLKSYDNNNLKINETIRNFENKNEISNKNSNYNSNDENKISQKLRQLLTTDDWIINTPCADTLFYALHDNGIYKKITRMADAIHNEKYVMFKNSPNSYFDFSSESQMAIGNKFSWKITPININEGGVFFGVCVYDHRNPPASCIHNTDTAINMVSFSGILISYFSENCYHIDQFANNNYWNTPKHCLSESEVLNLQFDFYINCDKPTDKTATMKITYDDYEYYERSNIVVNQDGIKARPMLNECAYIYPKDSIIHISDSTVYK